MPKLKTHKGAAKRIKKTAGGKLKRSHAFHSHILTKKSSGRKRKLVSETDISKADSKNIKKMLPYL